MKLPPGFGWIPEQELRYALYAVKFQWTPDQVDQLPLELDPWLLPIATLIQDVANERAKSEQK